MRLRTQVDLLSKTLALLSELPQGKVAAKSVEGHVHYGRQMTHAIGLANRVSWHLSSEDFEDAKDYFNELSEFVKAVNSDGNFSRF